MALCRVGLHTRSGTLCHAWPAAECCTRSLGRQPHSAACSRARRSRRRQGCSRRRQCSQMLHPRGGTPTRGAGGSETASWFIACPPKCSPRGPGTPPVPLPCNLRLHPPARAILPLAARVHPRAGFEGRPRPNGGRAAQGIPPTRCERAHESGPPRPGQPPHGPPRSAGPPRGSWG